MKKKLGNVDWKLCNLHEGRQLAEKENVTFSKGPALQSWTGTEYAAGSRAFCFNFLSNVYNLSFSGSKEVDGFIWDKLVCFYKKSYFSN